MELDKKKLKGLLKEQREEYQKYLGGVAEDFSSKLKIIAESASGIQKQLIALRDMVARNTEDIESLKINVEVIKSDIGIIKNHLKRKVDIDEFAALERRVALLERRR